MIGDGMGVNQVFATERYLGSLQGGHGREALTMTTFPNVGLSHTYSTSNGITDSAAGGTRQPMESSQWTRPAQSPTKR